jgi:hypothetical protein
LYYRFTPEVWAWIFQQLGKLRQRYKQAREQQQDAETEKLKALVVRAAQRLRPLYAWAIAHFTPTDLFFGAKPDLPPPPVSKAVLCAMDEDDRLQ